VGVVKVGKVAKNFGRFEILRRDLVPQKNKNSQNPTIKKVLPK
jgi:hypothetical protein